MSLRGIRFQRVAVAAILALALGALLLLRPWQAQPTPATPSPTAPFVAPATLPTEDASLTADRQRMVETQIYSRGVTDTAVLSAMETVPRHLFVPADWVSEAYDDHPLPIGYGQTISQPYIVAWMTELLRLKRGQRVLEIGTGSGYQAAILAQMGMQVYSVEIVEPLATQAAARLAGLGYANVVVQHADGYYGWAEHAPFDGIVVTCAPDHIPPPLVQQLADGGRMVLPVGPPGGYQSLWLVEKRGDQVYTEELGGVIFVPLTGPHSPDEAVPGSTAQPQRKPRLP
jgi:protein-L-isoaspartate(D-aspartate) O-methyltransferase